MSFVEITNDDCPALDVIPKLNVLLEEHGLEFVSDEEKDEEAYREGIPSVYFRLEKKNER